jgi:sugar/nucleoside kinase (ribokinase family)
MTTPPFYYLIGHVTHDVTPNGPKLGGTVSYAGAAAAAMGGQIELLTSARADEPVLAELPAGITMHLKAAPESSTFENIYTRTPHGEQRTQYLHSRAATLTPADMPDHWRNTPTNQLIVQLSPLTDEVSPDWVDAFPGALIAATPQGWLRVWDTAGEKKGLVRAKPWEHAARLLPALNAVILSEEDIDRDTSIEAYYASLARLLVVTRAAAGCTLYQQGETPLNVPAPSVPVADATGAGDIFAGVFLMALQTRKNILQAAQIANHLASCSVTRVGLASMPTPQEIAEALAKF